jgi:hypothetical protein
MVLRQIEPRNVMKRPQALPWDSLHQSCLGPWETWTWAIWSVLLIGLRRRDSAGAGAQGDRPLGYARASSPLNSLDMHVFSLLSWL